MGRIPKDEIEQEIKALKKLCRTGHRNLVSVLSLGELPNSYLFFIDMELCQLSLQDYLYDPSTSKTDQPVPRFITDAPPPFRAQQIWQIIYDIANGVHFIHTSKMVHRDIKPSNSIIPFFLKTILTIVLYSQRDLGWKLADFGFASEIGSRSHLSSVYGRGTEGYRALELLSLTGENVKYTEKVDIWSIGCVLFEMATVHKLFPSDFATLEYARTQQIPRLFFDPASFSSECQNRMSRHIVEMLQIEPLVRPSAGDLVQQISEFLPAVAHRVPTQKFVDANTRLIQMCGEALLKCPEAFWLWHFLCKYYLEIGDIQGAIRVCEDKLFLDPLDRRSANLAVLMQLQNLYAMNGDYLRAVHISGMLFMDPAALRKVMGHSSGLEFPMTSREREMQEVMQRYTHFDANVNRLG